jgi:hypothetical protein
MSSRRDEQKAFANETRAIDRAVDETKDNTRKVIQEVKRELPESTATFHDFQEQNINDAKEMANTFLDSQKEVAKSLHAALRPYTGNPFFGFMFWPYDAANPQTWAENYLKAATAFADTAAAGVKTQNDLMIEAFASARSLMNYAKENTKALAKLTTENARTFEQVSTNAARTAQTA